MINPNRIRLLQDGDTTNGPVIYWMSRDQRVHDNWALMFAQQLALEKKKSLVVMFNLVPAWAKHYEEFWLTIRRRNLWFIKLV